MPTPEKIGDVIRDPNNNEEVLGGIYSKRAYKEGTAADGDYSTNWLDFGFKPEQVFVQNDGGVPIELVFKHEIEGPVDEIPARVDSKLDASEARTYRRRNHRFVGIKGVGGTAAYRVEAW